MDGGAVLEDEFRAFVAVGDVGRRIHDRVDDDLGGLAGGEAGEVGRVFDTLVAELVAHHAGGGEAGAAGGIEAGEASRVIRGELSPGPHGRRALRWDVGASAGQPTAGSPADVYPERLDYFLSSGFAQVLRPKGRYAGQKPTKAVRSGTRPMRPSQFL